MIVVFIPVLVAAVVLTSWGRTPPRLPDNHEPARWNTERVNSAVSRRLVMADLHLGAEAAIRLWVTSTVVGAVLVASFLGHLTPISLIFGALIGAVGPVVVVVKRGDGASERLAQSLPEMLELLSRSLRGGADLHTALHDVARSDNEAGRSLGPVLGRVSAGERLGDAIDRWVVQLRHRDARIVRAVVGLGDFSGGSMAPALDRAASTIRERSSLSAEIRALTSQSRASAMVIGISPLAFFAVVAITDPKSSHILFASNIGRLCLGSGIFLDTLGLWWMSRLTSAVDE